MNQVALLYIQILLIVAIGWYDIRYRWVPLWLLVGAFIVVAARSVAMNGVALASHFFIINSVFLLLQLVLLSLYFMLRKKRLFIVFDKVIGWGDVFFLFILAGTFSELNFLLFLAAGYLLSLLAAIVIKGLDTKHDIVNNVPLAAMMAACYMVLLITDAWWLKRGLYNDQWILEYLY